MLLAVSLRPHFTSSIPRRALLSPSSLETAVDAGAKEDGNEGGNIPAPHPGMRRRYADKGISVSPTISEDELSREKSGEIGWWKNASTASFPDLGFRRN